MLAGVKVGWVVIAAAVMLPHPVASQPLPQMSFVPNSTTVSGFSYGGDFAIQTHVAFSKTIKGVCAFAAQPLLCGVQRFTRETTIGNLQPEAQGVPYCTFCPPFETLRFDHCRNTPSVVDVGKLPDWPRRNCGHPFAPDCLDDVINMYESRIYLQAGGDDKHTPVATVANTFAWYATMLHSPATDILYEEQTGVGHELPTLSTTAFDGPGTCFNHVYDTTMNKPADSPNPSSLSEFSQQLYLPGTQEKCNTSSCGWADKGLLYAPTACRKGVKKCKLHIMIHDCGTREQPSLPPPTTMSDTEETFARYAETNDIVLLMPRLEKGNYGKDAIDSNRGCFDVFGQLSGEDYAHQSSPHLGPFKPMMDALLGSKNIRINKAEFEVPSVSSMLLHDQQVKSSPWPYPDLTIIDLPQVNADLDRISSYGGSSGGDMAVQFQIGYSKYVTGLCGYDAQPYRCAATRFPGDVMLPQTQSSSVPHCFGCPPNKTVAYDHCKSHSDFVNTTLLANVAMSLPVCTGDSTPVDCIDSISNLKKSRIFLTRGECRTYTGSAVVNTADVLKKLGATNILYFDQCNPDGSHKLNDTTAMCLSHVIGNSSKTPTPDITRSFLFRQAPFVTDINSGFSEFGFVYFPKSCEDKSVKCGIQVRFHGCGGAGPADLETMGYAEANSVVIVNPQVPGWTETYNYGNNATGNCNAGTLVAGNCKEISRGCWDGYGQLSKGYHTQSSAHMSTVWNMIKHLASGVIP